MRLPGRRDPEREAQLGKRVLRFLRIAYDADGRGSVHPIGIAIALSHAPGPLGKVKEKEVARAGQRLQERGLVSVSELGDLEITERGVEEARRAEPKG